MTAAATDDCLITVVMAVYNAAEYLEQCLSSVLGQTHRKLQVICIDDGSSDASLELLENFAQRDNRLVVLTQENRGAGATRNRGLDLAQGDYLAFLDSDDLFQPRMLELALASCQRTGADFCLFGSRQFDSASGKTITGPVTLSGKQLPLGQPSFSFREIQGNIFNSMLGWAWDKLFRTSFVRQHQLRFLEQHNSEDLFFVYAALVLAKKISVVNRQLVNQRVLPANTAGASLSGSRASHCEDFFTSLMAFKSLLEEHQLCPELERDFINYALNYALWNLETLPGPAFTQVYQMLKTEGFAALGISDKPQQYFDNRQHYARYQEIIHLDPVSFLQNDLGQLKAKLRRLIDAVPFGLGKLAYSLMRGR